MRKAFTGPAGAPYIAVQVIERAKEFQASIEKLIAEGKSWAELKLPDAGQYPGLVSVGDLSPLVPEQGVPKDFMAAIDQLTESISFATRYKQWEGNGYGNFSHGRPAVVYADAAALANMLTDLPSIADQQRLKLQSLKQRHLFTLAQDKGLEKPGELSARLYAFLSEDLSLSGRREIPNLLNLAVRVRVSEYDEFMKHSALSSSGDTSVDDIVYGIADLRGALLCLFELRHLYNASLTLGDIGVGETTSGNARIEDVFTGLGINFEDGQDAVTYLCRREGLVADAIEKVMMNEADCLDEGVLSSCVSAFKQIAVLYERLSAYEDAIGTKHMFERLSGISKSFDSLCRQEHERLDAIS